ncbi:MAG: RapZ C-terminal domain-containing protein, partial [Burkholderiales bacterium]
YLDGQEAVQRLIAYVRDFLGRWLPEIEREQRNYVTVAIGCTGGRHRSVYLAERLAAAFRGKWRVLVRHRGLAHTGPEGAP